MSTNIPFDLIAKHLAGECNDLENKQVLDWKNSSDENAEIFRQMEISWEATTPSKYEANIDRALEQVSDRLTLNKTPKLVYRRLIVGIAASLIVALGVISLVQSNILSRNEIVIVTLSDAQPSLLELPDGSQIILNSGSMITYPKKFSKTERRITFSGEAYFDIIANELKPFIIESGKTETKVLGTEFNFKTIADSLVEVIVTEGLVALSIKENTTQEILLKTGQVGQYSSRENRLKKNENEDLNFLSWKDGKLRFDDQELKTAVSSISRHYKVKMLIEDHKLESLRFTASFDSLSFSEVIENMKLILDVEIESQDTVYVLK